MTPRQSSDQHGRQHGGRGAVVAELVGLVDGRREGLDAQQRERPELDQQMWSVTRSSPPDRAGTSCGSTVRPKMRHGPMADRARHVLQRRVHAGAARPRPGR